MWTRIPGNCAQVSLFLLLFCLLLERAEIWPWLLFENLIIFLRRRAVEPHSFYADPDPAVFLKADPDPDPGPGPGPGPA